ncbi:Receptor activity-modifying protein 1 Precursor [Channa argus]|uniref:Receptor activity-modifying protein 1 n=1 Tax=Channa argus TaxID=215402 RepID=A0A6G1PXR9_CHAAH|nr:Receptor activity-modifying protein 1 Precursor [Channa argus]
MVLTALLLPLILIWAGTAAKKVVPSCDQHMFDRNVYNCLSDFNRSMETSGYQDSCPWPTVRRFYIKLKYCVDDWVSASWCKGQGFLVDKVFLGVHQTYFSHCGHVHDPPLFTCIMLIVPVIIAAFLIPFLCINITTWMPRIYGH